jgi:hypothetical protein
MKKRKAKARKAADNGTSAETAKENLFKVWDAAVDAKIAAKPIGGTRTAALFGTHSWHNCQALAPT